MRRRILSAAFAVTAVLLTACNDNPLPTAPIVNGGPAALGSMTTDGCVDRTLNLFPPADPNVDTDVKFLITNLFIDANHQSSTLTMWENLKKDKLDSRPLQNHIDNLTKWTLEHLAAEDLRDPDGALLLNATTGAVRLLDLVFRCAGETPTQVPEPPEGFNAAFELVDPVENDDQQFNTSGGNAAGWFPPGSIEARTMLVLVFQPEEIQVNTPFPKLSQTVDVALAGGRLKDGQNLSVLFCPTHELSQEVNDRAVIAHQFQAVAPDAEPGEGVEYLDAEEGGSLLCPDGHASAWREEKGFLKQRAMQLAWYAKKAMSLVAPRSLYAGHAGIGGRFDADSESDFSPMVAVDPYLETRIVLSPIQQPIVYGRAVQVQARLQVTDNPANPAVYHNTWVNPDVVTGIVNQTKILPNTNVLMSARIDNGTPTVATTTDDSFGNWAFACVSAGNHTATVNFPETQVVANAPLYGTSTATTPEFTVQPRPITVTADDKTWVYGDNAPTLTGSITPAGNQGIQTQCGDAITPVYATTYDNTSDAGSYEGAISADVTYAPASTASNYVLTQVAGDVTITPRPINLTVVQPASRQYGDENGPALNAAYDATQFRNGDALTFDISSTAVPLSPAGTSWPITTTPTAPEGTRLDNYDVTVLPASPMLDITQRILTGSIANTSVVYGDPNPETFAGTVANTELCCGATDGLTVTFATTRTPLSSVAGSPYEIFPVLGGGPEANYDASAIVRGQLTVTQRPLTVTADDVPSREYGADNPTLTGTHNGVAGDVGLVVTYSTEATPNSDVGPYPIIPAIGGASAPNYAPVTLNNGTLTVTPAPLDIYADDYTRQVGVDNPDFTGSFGAGQIKNGDALTLTFSTSANNGSGAGSHPIVPTAVGDRISNYAVTPHNGTLTIIALFVEGVTGLLGSSSGEQRGGVGSRPNPGSLLTINTTTGAAAIVGATGVNSFGGDPGVSDIAVDPTTGELYGITGSACGGAILIRINRTTGAGTVVGTLMGSGFNGTGGTNNASCNAGSDGLAFSSDGTLYAGGWAGGLGSGSILRVDKNTAAVLQAFTTTGGMHLAGLSFAANGQLWASRGGNAAGVIHVINPATGQTVSSLTLRTATGAVDLAVVSDLAFAPDGTLWASLPRENVLARIDTATGVITRVGSFGAVTTRMSGLTFAP